MLQSSTMKTPATDVATAIGAGMLDDADRAIARSIFTTDDPVSIGIQLDSFCEKTVGSSAISCSLFFLSVGATFVLDLRGQEAVVVKAHGAHQDFEKLQACSSVQERLSETGFPCPTVIVSPVLQRETVWTIHSYVEHSMPENTGSPAIREAGADGLAKLLNLTGTMGTEYPFGRWSPRGTLWNEPHNVLFDFGKTSVETETIDDIARTAKEVIEEAAPREIVGHADWSCQNLSFQGDKLACVYDWDSLRYAPEECFVAGAACTFSNNYHQEPVIPIGPEEAGSFIESYEASRGRPFTSDEHKVLRAAMAYAVGYWARCVVGYENVAQAKADDALARLSAFSRTLSPTA